MITSFRKMHGLGNDFVILDARQTSFTPAPAWVRAVAARRTGVGCDQLIVIEPASTDAAAFLRIYNADGSQAEACGNATRCVASVLMQETGLKTITLDTAAGRLTARATVTGLVAVDMGPAHLGWQTIPLADAADTLAVPLGLPGLPDPVAVNLGNPHAVFLVDDVEAIAVADIGPTVETSRWFPARTNVEFVQVLDRSRLRLRVWERGAGITQACGSGACAAVVAAVRRDLTERSVEVLLDGGALSITWGADDHVWMTGPVADSFTGMVSPTLSTIADPP